MTLSFITPNRCPQCQIQSYCLRAIPTLGSHTQPLRVKPRPRPTGLEAFSTKCCLSGHQGMESAVQASRRNTAHTFPGGCAHYGQRDADDH